MTKVSVKTGDTVLVNSGKDSGKIGKVLAVKKNKDHVRVVVEGVNMVTKAKRARTAQEKSELVKQEAAIDVSNVNVICAECDKAVRVKHAVIDGKKVRVCPKCGASLDGKYVKSTGKKAEKTEDKKAAKAAAKAEKKSKTTKADQEKKATKTATQKKPTTTRSSQRGV